MEGWWKRMEKRKRRSGGGGDWRWQKEGGVVMQGGFCFLFNFLPLSSPLPDNPLSNELSVSHILNLPSKHSRMIGAVSQSNVLFATGERQRGWGTRRVITVENTLCLIDTLSTFTPKITNGNFEGGKRDARVVYMPSLNPNITCMIWNTAALNCVTCLRK